MKSRTLKNSLMESIPDKKRRTTSEVAEELEITSYQARYYLQQLEREGILKRTPPRRGAATLWERVIIPADKNE